MLTVTETASDHLATLLQQSKAPDDAAIRVVANDRGLGMHIDKPKPEDEAFNRDGKPLLVIDSDLANKLSERTLDVQQTEKGPALAIK